MPGELITVASFHSLQEAHLAKGLLETHGIDVFLADENMVRMNHLYSDLIGGVRLQVRTEDSLLAQELLDVTSETNDTREPSEELTTPCPRCGNPSPERLRDSRKGALSWLLLGLPLLFAWRRLKCRICGKVWRYKPESVVQ